MTKEKATQQANMLVGFCRQNKKPNIKLGELNIIDIDKFLDIHEIRLGYFEPLSKFWKLHYYRMYELKKFLESN